MTSICFRRATSEKEKHDPIADAESRIAELKPSVEELAGEYAALNAKVENYENEMS